MLLRRLDRQMFAPVPAEHVSLLRLALALVVAIRLATSRYTSLADLPDEMFDPTWFLGWLDGVPPASVLVAVQLLGAVAALAVVASRGRSAPAFAAAWLALAFLAGLQTSGGKILHNDVLLLLSSAPFVLGARRVGERVEGWQHRTAMAVVAFGYFFSGAMKLRHSGLEWVFSENLRWVLYAGANTERSILPGLGRALADQLWLTVVVAGATLATELLFPLVLVGRRLRVPVAVAVVGLHVGVFLLLGLDYWTWVASVLIFFVPWTVRASAGRVSWVTLSG